MATAATCIHEMGELALDIVGKALLARTLATRRRPIGEEVAAVMERFFTQAALSFLLPDKFPIPKTAAVDAVEEAARRYCASRLSASEGEQDSATIYCNGY